MNKLTASKEVVYHFGNEAPYEYFINAIARTPNTIQSAPMWVAVLNISISSMTFPYTVIDWTGRASSARHQSRERAFRARVGERSEPLLPN
jgi:hypothetical protein